MPASCLRRAYKTYFEVRRVYVRHCQPVWRTCVRRGGKQGSGVHKRCRMTGVAAAAPAVPPAALEPLFFRKKGPFFEKNAENFEPATCFFYLFLKRKFLAEQIFEINNSFAKDPTFLKQNAIAFATVSVIKLDSF